MLTPQKIEGARAPLPPPVPPPLQMGLTLEPFQSHFSFSASGATSQTTSNMLRVPSSGYGGAIPRRPFSRDSSAESTSSSVAADTTKTCFCGHYTEVSIIREL